MIFLKLHLLLVEGSARVQNTQTGYRLTTQSVPICVFQTIRPNYTDWYRLDPILKTRPKSGDRPSRNQNQGYRPVPISKTRPKTRDRLPQNQELRPKTRDRPSQNQKKGYRLDPISKTKPKSGDRPSRNQNQGYSLGIDWGQTGTDQSLFLGTYKEQLDNIYHKKLAKGFVLRKPRRENIFQIPKL